MVGRAIEEAQIVRGVERVDCRGMAGRGSPVCDELGDAYPLSCLVSTLLPSPPAHALASSCRAARMPYRKASNLSQWQSWAPSMLDNYATRSLLGRHAMHCRWRC